MHVIFIGRVRSTKSLIERSRIILFCDCWSMSNMIKATDGTVIARKLSAEIDKNPNIVPIVPKKSQDEIISPSDGRTVRDKYVMIRLILILGSRIKTRKPRIMMRSFAMYRSNSSSLYVRTNCPTIVCRFQEFGSLPDKIIYHIYISKMSKS